ncbi:hypothetical protein [Streptomyces sp. NPDC051001]|uniref:hypothetical protein n=1 Tax=Streptomyces sp. NPDC051001 TaxID=3155795 RepID=UPI0034289D2F
MADPNDPWRRLLEANTRYLDAWGQLTVRWLTELTQNARVTSDAPGAPREATVRHPDPAQAGPPRPMALVLEGRAGTTARGAFLVENHFPHPVEGAVEVVTDGDGPALPLVFEPSPLSLPPGEQTVVRVGILVPEELDPDRDHHVTFRVVGVDGPEIPAVVRRLPT